MAFLVKFYHFLKIYANFSILEYKTRIPGIQKKDLASFLTRFEIGD